MRLSLRFILPLLLVLGVVAYSVVPLVDSLTLKWFTRDLESRSKLLASTMEVPLSDLVATRSRTKIFAYFHKVIQDERLYALGFCDTQQRLLYQTLTYPDQLSCESLAHLTPGSSEVMEFAQGPLHVVVATIQSGGKIQGRLMLVHDMSFVHQRSTDTKWYIFYLFVGLAALISAVTVLVAQLSWRGWVAGVRAMLTNTGLPAERGQAHSPELHPLAQDLQCVSA